MVSSSRIDPRSGCSAAATIYTDENGVRWTFMLNQTDIAYGILGHNKFYTASLIRDGCNYIVHRRFGRVGVKAPQSVVDRCGTDLERAKSIYKKVFVSKSGNSWPLKGPFQKKPKRYVLIDLDDEAEDQASRAAAAKSAEEDKYQPCSLVTPVQELLQLVCNPDTIAREMEELNIDLKRMPLGKLSKAQISQGYTILQQLSTALEEIAELEAEDAAPASATAPTTRSRGRGRGQGQGRGRGRGKAKATTATRAQAQANSARVRELRNDLRTLSSEFYTLIPHDFGRSLPPVLGTMEDVKQKLEMLEVLSNLEISQGLEVAQKKNAKKSTKGLEAHPLDMRYQAIKADMKPLDRADDEFKLIEQFVKASNSNSVMRRCPTVHSVLKVARPAEEDFQDDFFAVDNHQLLWHGSRLSNIVGILSQGLRIAPPEAPVNGYNFGKGLYFADTFAKSSMYCCISSVHPRGVLFLAEVALGKQYKTPSTEYLDYKKVRDRGCDSTHGMGNMEPAEAGSVAMRDGVTVPVGELKPTNRGAHLLYNEFIVYRPEQVKLRYVLTVDF